MATTATFSASHSISAIVFASCILRGAFEQTRASGLEQPSVCECELLVFTDSSIHTCFEFPSHAVHIAEILLDWDADFRPLAKAYKSAPELQHTPKRPPPHGYKTSQFPLRATTTPDTTVENMIEIFREVYEDQLQMDAPKDLNWAIPTYNDQASNSLIRGMKARRKGDNTPFTRADCFQIGPGMWHLGLNYLWHLLAIHRGHVDDLGSLESFFTANNKVRHGSEHPDYHALKASTSQVLFGIILHAWELECPFSSLSEFAASKPSASMLLDIAYTILDKHVSTPSPDDCRLDPCDPETEDGVRRNVKLLCRDLLRFHTFHRAVKSGDAGRIFELLGDFTIWFCGAGAKNYTTELLHFIRNLKKVWPPEFA